MYADHFERETAFESRLILESAIFGADCVWEETAVGCRSILQTAILVEGYF